MKKKKSNTRRGTLKFIIIMAASSLLVSFLVKTYLVSTRQKVMEEKLEFDPSSTTQPLSHIKKGRGFEDKKTIEGLSQAIKEDSQNADLYNKKGNRYLLDKKFQKAIEEFDKAIRINSNYAEPYNGKGVAYRNLGEYHEAIENYTKAIELDPSYFEAYNNRGVCFIFLGEHSNACFDFEKACELGSCQKLEMSKQKGFCE